MEDDITYTESALRPEGDIQPYGTLPGSTGMVHNPEDAYRKNGGEDANADDNDNNPTHREMERTQEDTRNSLKRKKKKKIDKNGEQQTERSRRLPRWMTLKGWNS